MPGGVGLVPGKISSVAGELESRGPYDYVFHFAAYAAEGLSPWCSRYVFDRNVGETAALLNMLLRTQVSERFVFTSSMASYGAGPPPFSEDHSTRPVDPYGISKLAGEQLIQVLDAQFGLPWCILRPHDVYGPGQAFWTKHRAAFGIWMARCLRGEPQLVYGDGLQRRAFSYVGDCLPCIWQAAVAPAALRQTINIGGEHPTRLIDAARLVAEVTGCSVGIQHTEPRHEVRDAWCTVEKSRRLLRYQERTSLREGLAAMWDWVQQTCRAYPELLADDKSPPLEHGRELYGFWR